MPGSVLEFDRIGHLARRAQGGDAEAFRQLLEAHRSAVTSTLTACGVRSRETARDLAQETAISAWTRLSTLEDPKSFPAWIRRIAANAARDHLRRLAVRSEEDLDEALDLVSADDPHQRTERIAEVRLMVAALGDEEESIVELLRARAAGVPIEQLAESTGSSAGALKMRLTRARKRLRRRLKELRST